MEVIVAKGSTSVLLLGLLLVHMWLRILCIAQICYNNQEGTQNVYLTFAITDKLEPYF